MELQTRAVCVRMDRMSSVKRVGYVANRDVYTYASSYKLNASLYGYYTVR